MIRERAAKLERFHDRIVRCHVIVDVPHRHHHKGRLYAVHVDVTTPTGEVAASRSPTDDHSHRDLNTAVRDAFDTVVRQLEDEVRYRRGDVKTHEEPDRGHITRLFPPDGYGFLVTPDDVEVYFHENSVADGAFSRLQVGSNVRFVLAPNESDKGPQASTVRLLEHNRI